MSIIDSLNDVISTVTDGTLNRYHLDIPSCLSPLDVEDFAGSEGLSETYLYNIMFTSSDKDIDASQLLRKPASLKMGTGILKNLTGQKVVHGVITDFQRMSSSADQVRYQITLEPFLALLNKQFRTHRFFINKSIPEVVEEILVEHGFEGWEYEFTLKQTYPKREQINQYQESDLTFIQRLLSELGIFYYFSLHPDTQTEVVHFSDQQSTYEFGKALPLNSPSGMSDSGIESVWGLNVQHNVVEGSVTAKDYNHREAQKVLQSNNVDAANTSTEDITYGEVYHYKPRYLDNGDKVDPTAETGNFLARLDHERFLSNQTLITGISNHASLSPGQVLTITEPSIVPTLPSTLSNGTVVTGVFFSGSRQNPLSVSWLGFPYIENQCWRPTLLPRPKVQGTMMARVTSPIDNDQYAHIDKSGLYWVKFDADRDDKKKGYESMPVRLAKPYGGDVYGIHFPLIQGAEVAIAFHEGDPDRPYIAHAMHDSRHVDHVTSDNNTRNVIRTPTNNKLRMEDKRGEEHVKLSTEYAGKSQLNLGHLVNEKREKRGEGFELRTDKWGAIRGGQGVFITADEKKLASGEALSMQETVDRMKQASSEMESISNDAEKAKADPAQLSAQVNFLKEQVEELKQAVAILSAPKGIALTSGKHIQLAAKDNVMLNSGANTDVGVVKRLFMGIGEGLSVFVRKLGIKIIANQGAVTIQAQNDELQLLANKGLEIVSTDDEIQIVAKKKITLNAGGTYITLSPTKIEHGTPGDFEIKSADFKFLPPASMKASHPEYPKLQAQGKQSFFVNAQQTPDAYNSNWAGFPYKLYADEVLIHEGVFDEEGRIELDHQVVTKSYRVEMPNGENFSIPIATEYRNKEEGILANKGIHKYTSSEGKKTDHRNIYNEILNGKKSDED